MVQTVDSRLAKLEARNGPAIDDDITFTVYLVKPKGDGSMLRRGWPDGKYSKIDPKSLGIEPYKATTKHAPKIVEPPVTIAVPKENEIQAHEETPEERIERIKQQIYEEFGNDY
jgi:hypothetical protein